jgi:hypothetical protein
VVPDQRWQFQQFPHEITAHQCDGGRDRERRAVDGC